METTLADPATALVNMTSQDLVQFVTLILFFDVIVLGSLAYYYQKLQYPHLKFIAFALVAEMLAQAIFIGWGVIPSVTTLFVIGGLAKVGYGVLMLAGISHLVNQAVPKRLILSMVILFLGCSMFIRFVGVADPVINSLLFEAAPVVLLSVGIYMVWKNRESVGLHFLMALLAIHIGLKIAMPITVDDPGISNLFYLFSCLVIVMIGFVQLIIAFDRMMQNIKQKNDQLNEYKQENRRLEVQFTQAQKLESLGVLAGGIAHDFNNMLTSILGYASLAMKKLPASSEVRKDLYMVMSGARQAVDLTSQMLIYAGKGAIEFEATDISRVVDGMSSLINSIMPRKIRLVQKVSRDLPQMKADKVQLGQVLMNLVANAVDAIESRQGTIEISTGLVDIDERMLRQSFFSEDLSPGAYLFVSVKDSGVGIDESQIEKIFDPFYSEKGVSKGLGLSSISGIVRQHKGCIRVHSEPGEGAEFTVYFPVLSYEESPPVGSDVFHPQGTQKGKILLADDDPRIRNLIESILEGDSFQLTSTADGSEAMKMVSEYGPSYVLFLLDCTMPKMSGTEVYRQIRQQGLRTPVILISGYHQDQVITNINSDDNAYFIKKPFNVDELLDRVNQALYAHAHPSAKMEN